jgi:hypothetical protein
MLLWWRRGWWISRFNPSLLKETSRNAEAAHKGGFAPGHQSDQGIIAQCKPEACPVNGKVTLDSGGLPFRLRLSRTLKGN